MFLFSFSFVLREEGLELTLDLPAHPAFPEKTGCASITWVRKKSKHDCPMQRAAFAEEPVRKRKALPDLRLHSYYIR